MPGFSWCSCKVCQLKASSYFLLSSHSSQKYINFQVLSEAHVSQLENLLWGAKPAPVPAFQLPLAAWGLLPVCCSLGSQERSHVPWLGSGIGTAVASVTCRLENPFL